MFTQRAPSDMHQVSRQENALKGVDLSAFSMARSPEQGPEREKSQEQRKEKEQEKERDKSTSPKQEPNPSHFSGGNPVYPEIRTEKWFGRAAWTTIALNYATSVYLILEGEPRKDAQGAAAYLLLDAYFAYGAVKAANIRRHILEGDLLPDPAQAAGIFPNIRRIGSIFYFFGSACQWFMCAASLVTGNIEGGVVRGVMGLSQLHLGVAWVRQNRFHRKINSL